MCPLSLLSYFKIYVYCLFTFRCLIATTVSRHSPAAQTDGRRHERQLVHYLHTINSTACGGDDVETMWRRSDFSDLRPLLCPQIILLKTDSFN